MNSRINVLIPDGDSTWALSVMHCLSQVEAYRLFVLSNKKRTATKFSKYTTYYKFYERPDDAGWMDIINTAIENNSISVVLPIAEHEVSFFIKHKDNMSGLAKVAALPELKNFEIAIHKNKLSDFAKTHDIPHPKSFYFTAEHPTSKILSDIQFPILIKPLHQKGGEGIEKMLSKAEFPTHISEPIFIQEYIEGYDIDCSVLCLNGNILTHTIQKGNLPGSTTYAPQLRFDFIDNDDVLAVAQDVMSKLNWSGVAHLDMRYDENTKDYKLIEINARFWGSVEASEVAGINFPHLSVQLALGETISHKHYQTVSYMRLKGVLKLIKRRPTFILKRSYLMKNTEVRMLLKDPIPTVYKFKEWFGRQF